MGHVSDGRVVMEAKGIKSALERLSGEIIASSRDPGKLALVGIHTGGVFLANSVLPAQHPPELEFLGRRSVSYSSTAAYGDDVVVYRRR